MGIMINLFEEEKHSNAFNNLNNLFAICETMAEYRFYSESAEYCYKQNFITAKELFSLRVIARKKLEEIREKNRPKAKIADKPGLYYYYPEMGEPEPVGCQMSASLSHYGTHYYITSSIELKGRGITFMEKNEKFFEYRCTPKAYEKLQKLYSIKVKSLL